MAESGAVVAGLAEAAGEVGPATGTAGLGVAGKLDDPSSTVLLGPNCEITWIPMALQVKLPGTTRQKLTRQRALTSAPRTLALGNSQPSRHSKRMGPRWILPPRLRKPRQPNLRAGWRTSPPKSKGIRQVVTKVPLGRPGGDRCGRRPATGSPAARKPTTSQHREAARVGRLTVLA